MRISFYTQPFGRIFAAFDVFSYEDSWRLLRTSRLVPGLYPKIPISTPKEELLLLYQKSAHQAFALLVLCKKIDNDFLVFCQKFDFGRIQSSAPMIDHLGRTIDIQFA
jgi:hypothetical protein